jgi:hypothetical protein
MTKTSVQHRAPPLRNAFFQSHEEIQSSKKKGSIFSNWFRKSAIKKPPQYILGPSQPSTISNSFSLNTNNLIK